MEKVNLRMSNSLVRYLELKEKYSLREIILSKELTEFNQLNIELNNLRKLFNEGKIKESDLEMDYKQLFDIRLSKLYSLASRVSMNDRDFYKAYRELASWLSSDCKSNVLYDDCAYSVISKLEQIRKNYNIPDNMTYNTFLHYNNDLRSSRAFIKTSVGSCIGDFDMFYFYLCKAKLKEFPQCFSHRGINYITMEYLQNKIDEPIAFYKGVANIDGYIIPIHSSSEGVKLDVGMLFWLGVDYFDNYEAYSEQPKLCEFASPVALFKSIYQRLGLRGLHLVGDISTCDSIAELCNTHNLDLPKAFHYKLFDKCWSVGLSDLISMIKLEYMSSKLYISVVKNIENSFCDYFSGKNYLAQKEYLDTIIDRHGIEEFIFILALSDKMINNMFESTAKYICNRILKEIKIDSK